MKHHKTFKALGDSIVFQFEDNVRNGRFVDETPSGIFIGFNHDISAKAPRKGIVLAIGPDVKDVKVGDTILIEALMWSEGVKYKGEMFWKTAEHKVLALVG